MGSNLICRAIMIVFLLSATTAFAQQSNVDSLDYKPLRQIELSGPRVGLTFITGALADTLNSKYDASPLITQFGWQFEQRFISTENGLTGLTEFVPLIGGLEQGLFLPSLSFIVGLRTATGSEFGFGPNVSISGVAYVFAGGVTKQHGDLYFPINASLILTKNGARISLLVGFNSVAQPDK